MLGLIKVILIIWIVVIVKRWYDRLGEGKRRPSPEEPPTRGVRIESPGGIEDAQFEDIDENRPHT